MACIQGKTIYKTEGEARSAIRGMRLQGKKAAGDLRIYSCGLHFHLTRQASITAKVTKPRAQENRTEPLPLTKAEIRHTKNRLADIGRQIEKGFARLAEERFQEAMRRWRADEQDRIHAKILADDIQYQRAILDLLGIKVFEAPPERLPQVEPDIPSVREAVQRLLS